MDSVMHRQLLFVVPVLLNAAFILPTGQAVLGAGDAYLGGLALVVLATVAAVANETGRFPTRLLWLVPVLDLLAVGALRLVPENGGVGVLVVLPAVWLGVDLLERGVLLTAVLTLTTVSVPQLAVFGTGADSWSRAVLLPVVAANVAMAGAALARRWTRQTHRLAIKHEELEKTYEHEHRVAARQELIAATIDVGLVMIDRSGAYTSLNSKQRELLDVGYPHGHRGQAGQEGMVFAEDRVTPLRTRDMPTTRALRGERFTDYVIWVGDPAVRQLAISVSAAPMFDELGDFDGAVLVYKDVTELVSALRVKDDFVATVSHELRTPLTSIMGFLDLVTETDESLSESTRAQLSIVKRNSERLLRLVSDLLMAAQTDEGRLVLVRRLRDLSELVAQAVDDVVPQARDGEVRLERRIAPLVELEMDETRMRQMVDNLVSNAVKYTPPDGVVEVSLVDHGDRVVLRVSDTGIGIAVADQEHLFTRFFRAPEAETLAIQGAGLGLAITKAIVEAHAGTIEVDSEPGRGTRFEVTLPRLTAVDPPDAGDAPSRSS
ncbi:HAMP domain-containing histidine kinase [Nocardioides sp. HDW12B]|uniref:sensor histidine kinase n=1 Tax=Nocardioides sp. HDW12B TaxID=2714939 RepID=UPI00140AFA35|nr:HAMP domain-containing sensor histidine kinase [Nocardioides sp. HDW12B]QIK65841.1 HAMP domain-containing histidine kinase [Nocardioides sp. HDW12B]